MEERRARVLDISRYWRTGGTNWEMVKENFDAVIFSAGVGGEMDVLLPEHVEGARGVGIPYATYYIPDPNLDMNLQARMYAGFPGVHGGRVFGDWEPPYRGARLQSPLEMERFLKELENAAGKDVGIYTRWDIVKGAGIPSWFKHYDTWIAQYLYNKVRGADGKWKKYRNYDDFLQQRAGTVIPPSMNGTGFEAMVKLWQITDWGDARRYAANVKTKDPIFIFGMTSADLSLSVEPVEEFMQWFCIGGEVEPLEPIEEKAADVLDTIEERLGFIMDDIEKLRGMI